MLILEKGSTPIWVNVTWDRTACVGLHGDPTQNGFRVAQSEESELKLQTHPPSAQELSKTLAGH